MKRPLLTEGRFPNAALLTIQARELARIAEEEAWAGEIQVHDDQEDRDRALGTGRQEYGLVSVWWD